MHLIMLHRQFFSSDSPSDIFILDSASIIVTSLTGRYSICVTTQQLYFFLLSSVITTFEVSKFQLSSHVSSHLPIPSAFTSSIASLMPTVFSPTPSATILRQPHRQLHQAFPMIDHDDNISDTKTAHCYTNRFIHSRLFLRISQCNACTINIPD